MRIIGGNLKGRKLHPPRNLPVRPTTDFAKEALFNILANYFDFEDLNVLDLFAGTGNMSLEFISRGCASVTAVDASIGCVRYINNTAEALEIDNLFTERIDVFDFLQGATDNFDFIFADPPYKADFHDELIELIFSSQILNANGWFVLEHQSNQAFENHPNFKDCRKYGSSSFTIFG